MLIVVFLPGMHLLVRPQQHCLQSGGSKANAAAALKVFISCCILALNRRPSGSRQTEPYPKVKAGEMKHARRNESIVITVEAYIGAADATSCLAQYVLLVTVNAV
jgi:hypothetical protein